MKYTVAVDFDGVLHSYTSTWAGASVIPDPPVPGAIAWLTETLKHFDVAILSTRNHQAGGPEAMALWLLENGLSAARIAQISFPAEKPAALIYIDDRAWRFDGTNWPTRQEIHAAKPWNKPL